MSDVDEEVNLNELDAEQRFPGDWNESSANLLEDWLKNCKNQTSIHVAAARKKRFRYRVIALPTILLSATASALAFFVSGTGCEGDYDPDIQIVTSITASLATVLTAVQTLFAFNTTQQRHVHTASRFTTLAQQIKIQLYLPIARKDDVEITLREITNQFADIVNNAPLL
jgi:hypothetical protein